MPRKRDYIHALDAQISAARLAAERCQLEAEAHIRTVKALQAAKATIEEKVPVQRKPRKPKVPVAAVAVGAVDTAVGTADLLDAARKAAV